MRRQNYNRSVPREEDADVDEDGKQGGVQVFTFVINWLTISNFKEPRRYRLSQKFI
jgi:hypothetical protein